MNNECLDNIFDLLKFNLYNNFDNFTYNLRNNQSKIIENDYSRTINGERRLSYFIIKFINCIIKKTYLLKFLEYKKYILSNINFFINIFEELLI